MSIDILACQIELPIIHTISERESYLDQLLKQISQCLENKAADIVFLPELTSIGYPLNGFDQIKELAEDLKGDTVSKFSQLARKYHTRVCFGFPRREEDRLMLSQVVIDDLGQVAGCYDKIHLDPMEEAHAFKAGDHLLVCEIAGLKIGVMICFDFRFPELARTLAIEHNVDVILHAVANKKDDTFKSWPSFVMTRALENEVYWLSLNYAGQDFGESMFCPPRLEGSHSLERLSTDEEFHYFTVDDRYVKAVRQASNYRSIKRQGYANLTQFP